MKRKNLSRSQMQVTKTMPISPTGHLTEQIGQVTLLSFHESSSLPRFQKLMEDHDLPSSLTSDINIAADEEKDCILSQDFFCTPDYITPDGQPISDSFDFRMENVPCPKSPEKSKVSRSKRYRQEEVSLDILDTVLPCHQQIQEHATDSLEYEDENMGKTCISEPTKKKNYVSQSAVALRCRVMPPPCIKNPYLNEAVMADLDFFDNQRSKCTGFFSSVTVGDGGSRYRTDFHVIEQIGFGNFSRVFKVLKRIDGCLYAVKYSIRQLHQNTERRRALMEVQALAALGSHENIVGYYTSWFENEQLYIQMELCERSLSLCTNPPMPTEKVLAAMYQIAKALQFMHERGIAHLDVKPDNIYMKNGVFKLGDFGFATLLDRTLPVEEGDARYMPPEILNENFEHLDKVDIFSLGVAVYELLKGSPLPDSGTQLLNLREGKILLLPGHSMQLQNLLKTMLDPEPARRPSATELLGNPIFERVR
ncbi:wee1-like protein kinase [Aristolochia californica]|uniref:wee1-like protein kinase n=1 Tax=Aristolochia californica TaxID=171875 RepID=UPI0035D6F98A